MRVQLRSISHKQTTVYPKDFARRDRLRRNSEGRFYACPIVVNQGFHPPGILMVSSSTHISVMVTLAVCLLGGACKQQVKPAAAMGMPVVPVSAANATQEPVPTELRVVGTVEASAIVQVKSQIAGQLERIG